MAMGNSFETDGVKNPRKLARFIHRIMESSMSLVPVFILWFIRLTEAIVIRGYDVSRYGFLYIGIANVVIFIFSIITIVSVLVYRSKKQQHKLEVAEGEEIELLEKVDRSARSRPDLDELPGPEQAPLLPKVVRGVLSKVSAANTVHCVVRVLLFPLVPLAMEPQLPECIASIKIGGFVIGLLPNDKDSIDARFERRVPRNLEDNSNCSQAYLSAEECVNRLYACLDLYAGRITQIILIDIYRRSADCIAKVVEAARTRAPLVKVITARQAQLAYGMNAVAGNPDSVLSVTFLPNLMEIQSISRRHGAYIPNNYIRLPPSDHLNRIHYQISCHRPSCIVILAANLEEIRDLVVALVDSLPSQIQCVIKYLDYWHAQFLDGGLLTALRPGLVADIGPGFYGTVLYGSGYEEVCFFREGNKLPITVKSGFRRPQKINLVYDAGVAVYESNLLKMPKCSVYHPGILLNGDPDQVILNVDENGIVSIPADAAVEAPEEYVPPTTADFPKGSKQMVIDLHSGQSLVYNGDDKPNTRWQRALPPDAKKSYNTLLDAVEYLIRASRAIRVLILTKNHNIPTHLTTPSTVESVSTLELLHAATYYGISKILATSDPLYPFSTVILGFIRDKDPFQGFVFKRSNPNTFTLVNNITENQNVAHLHPDISMILASPRNEPKDWMKALPGYQLISVPDWDEIALEGGLFKLINPTVCIDFNREKPAVPTQNVQPVHPYNYDGFREHAMSSAIPTTSIASEMPVRFIIELNLVHGCRLLAVFADGRETPIPDVDGHTWSPLYISVASNVVKTGYKALADLEDSPRSVIYGILPFLGQPVSEVNLPDHNFHVGPKGDTFMMGVFTERGYAQVTQEHYIGANLITMRNLAQDKYGNNIDISTIRVPASFSAIQYKIIKDAGEYAELGSFSIESVRVN